MSDHVAVFVDGDNISACHAGEIESMAKELGTPILLRAYGNVNIAKMQSWQKHANFSMVHSGGGKNATDMLIAVDAMELALTRPLEKALLVSSDGDYRHLAFRLRELGLDVVGAGMQDASELFKSSCTQFIELACPKPASTQALPSRNGPKPSRLEQQIQNAISTSGLKGDGIRLTELNSIMRLKYDFKISDLSEKTWRSYLCKRSHLFALDSPGKEARVRAKVSELGTEN